MPNHILSPTQNHPVSELIEDEDGKEIRIRFAVSFTMALHKLLKIYNLL